MGSLTSEARWLAQAWCTCTHTDTSISCHCHVFSVNVDAFRRSYWLSKRSEGWQDYHTVTRHLEVELSAPGHVEASLSFLIKYFNEVEFIIYSILSSKALWRKKDTSSLKNKYNSGSLVLNGSEPLLLFQKTQAWFLALPPGISQVPITPAPGYQRPLLASTTTWMQVYILTHRYTYSHKQK